jgi:hypothetical protein
MSAPDTPQALTPQALPAATAATAAKAADKSKPSFLRRLRAKSAAEETAAKSGDIRLGMSFWGTATLVMGIASDLAKPVADLAPVLFVLCLLAAGAAAWATFIKKPPLPMARTALGALGIGVCVFGFFLIARTVATPEGLGEERGFIAAVAPPAAAVQTAVLPLSVYDKELLKLSSRLATGDPEARSAEARAALATTADPPLRRATLERILRSSDPNVRQAGLVTALADRGAASVPIIPEAGSDSVLATLLTGGQLSFTQVDVLSGGASGYLYAGNSRRTMSATVANGRLIASSQYVRNGRWANGLVIDLEIDDAFRLVGTARAPELEPIRVEVPLL